MNPLWIECLNTFLCRLTLATIGSTADFTRIFPSEKRKWIGRHVLFPICKLILCQRSFFHGGKIQGLWANERLGTWRVCCNKEEPCHCWREQRVCYQARGDREALHFHFKTYLLRQAEEAFQIRAKFHACKFDSHTIFSQRIMGMVDIKGGEFTFP